jgi:hypothetical protein
LASGSASSTNGAIASSPASASPAQHERHDDEAAVVLLGDEGHRRAVHDVGDRRQLVRRRLGGSHEPGDGLRGGRQDQHAAHDLVDLVEAELEASGDAVVAAAAADRPEQVGMRPLVDAEHVPVGGDDVGGEQAVDGEPELAGQVASPATEREPAEADGPHVAEAHRQAVGTGRGGELSCGETRLGPRRATAHVDLDGLHVSQVEDDASVDRAVAGAAVTAAAHGQWETGLPGQRDGPCDVTVDGRAHDHSRPGVEAARDDLSCLVVAVIARAEHATLELGAEIRQGDGAAGGERRHQLLLRKDPGSAM